LADRGGVAGEFGVATAGERFSLPGSGEATGAFPVADVAGSFESQFLIEKKGLDLSRELEGGDRDFPTGWVDRSAGRFPLIEGDNGEVG